VGGGGGGWNCAYSPKWKTSVRLSVTTPFVFIYLFIYLQIFNVAINARKLPPTVISNELMLVSNKLKIICKVVVVS